MEEYKRQAHEVLDLLDEKLSVYPVVQQASAATKVRPSHLAVGLVSFLLCFIFYGFGGRLVSNLVGFAWPLYESFHSLKNKPQPGIVDEEDSQWLTYWVVYSTFTLIESATDVLALWIPLYPVVKIAFLLWCMLPQTRGALLIYHSVIEPILVRYEGRIDGAHHAVKRSVSTVAADIADAGGDAIEARKRELVDGAISSLIGSNRDRDAAPGGPVDSQKTD